MTVLVVDDHEPLRALVGALLERSGRRMVGAADGREALKAFYRERPELVVLDVDMPRADGWMVLDRIRAISDVPVVMLSGNCGGEEKVRAFAAGADDYVTKPFNGSEFTARVTALLRRSRREDRLKVHDDGLVRIDVGRRSVHVAGRAVSLTPLEFRLLSTLVNHSGQVLSRDQLFDLVWADKSLGTGDEVRTYIGYLRRKLGTVMADVPIETVRGFGYRYEPDLVAS